MRVREARDPALGAAKTRFVKFHLANFQEKSLGVADYVEHLLSFEIFVEIREAGCKCPTPLPC